MRPPIFMGSGAPRGHDSSFRRRGRGSGRMGDVELCSSQSTGLQSIASGSILFAPGSVPVPAYPFGSRVKECNTESPGRSEATLTRERKVP